MSNRKKLDALLERMSQQEDVVVIAYPPWITVVNGIAGRYALLGGTEAARKRKARELERDAATKGVKRRPKAKPPVKVKTKRTGSRASGRPGYELEDNV